MLRSRRYSCPLIQKPSSSSSASPADLDHMGQSDTTSARAIPCKSCTTDTFTFLFVAFISSVRPSPHARTSSCSYAMPNHDLSKHASAGLNEKTPMVAQEPAIPPLAEMPTIKEELESGDEKPTVQPAEASFEEGGPMGVRAVIGAWGIRYSQTHLPSPHGTLC